ncbi:Sec-independent protein translocase protein TATB, chloroplastic [Sesamum alatum]|uniref:Sec-independent protein translocase protein TATB, chloroplastic n=1 Tax=Sesamum alatum TaxID=300844 RepID=A0AAE1YU44_9LAMI|nr:Sec-independent protein translocase protein TATB, chloroplastic [Sesamum alatum]
MAFAISTPTLHPSSSYPVGIPSLFVSVPKNAIFKAIPHLGFAPFSQWSGLKQLGISIPKSSPKMGGKGKCKGRGVYASLFGVGAPEALVIGVVALLVFGPKGLAEEVSREFKSSLEREIGLDEINNNPIPRTFSSDIPRTEPVDTSEDSGTNIESNESPEDNGSASESGAYTADEYLKVTQAQGTSQEPSSAMAPSQNPDIDALQESASEQT